MAEVTASASAVVQIQQSADGIRPKRLKRFNKPLKRFSTPLAIHPSLAENIEHFSVIHPSDCLSPATGYRYFASGALTAVGAEGVVWSSSSAFAGDIGAGDLYFRLDGVFTLYGSGRALGFAVRCVQHLQGYFPKKHFRPPERATGSIQKLCVTKSLTSVSDRRPRGSCPRRCP